MNLKMKMDAHHVSVNTSDYDDKGESTDIVATHISLVAMECVVTMKTERA